jgi:hypothetical protein
MKIEQRMEERRRGVSIEEEARVINKVTWYLLPYLSFLYLLCFLFPQNVLRNQNERKRDNKIETE